MPGGCSLAAQLTPGTGCHGAPLGVGAPHGEEQSSASPVSPQMSSQLEETSVTLRDTVAQLEQLMVANSRLSTGRGMGDMESGAAPSPLCPLSAPSTEALPLADLSSLMKNLANLEQERDVLQQENEKQWEEIAWWV